MSESFDAIVIGSGQGGGPLAGQLAGAGWKTAIIEREHVGGTCVNVGCTPTKTMIASARVAYLARRAADYGVLTGDVKVDMAVVRKRKRDIVQQWSDGSHQGLAKWDDLELIMGEASFRDERTVRVALNDGGERELTSGVMLINTGARPHVPPIDGLDDVAWLDSTSIMELGEVPEHLIVIGGGYIGLEFGQMFRRFGAQVTLIEQAERCLPREDADICSAMSEILEEDGVTLLTRRVASAVSEADAGVRVVVDGPEGRENIDGSHLLVAAGRRPNSDMLNLDAAGVRTDEKGFIPANERLETNVPGIYAFGDVNGGPAFTHIAYDDFRILKANLLDGQSRTTADRPVPYTMYTDPQLGRVGLNEQQASAQGIGCRVASMPMSHVARALEMDEPRGLMKVLVAQDDDRILGASILGIEGGEIMTIIQMAMMGGLPYTALRDAVFAHPTLAESLNNLFKRL